MTIEEMKAKVESMKAEIARIDKLLDDESLSNEEYDSLEKKAYDLNQERGNLQNKINKLFENEDGLSSFFEFCDSFFKNKTYADDETGIKFPKQRKGRKEERVSQNCEPCKKLPKLPKLYVKDKTIQKDSKIEVSKLKSRSRTICSKCGRCHNKRKNGKCPSF